MLLVQTLYSTSPGIAAAKTFFPPKSELISIRRNFINELSSSISGLVLENLLTQKMLPVSALLACNHGDRICYDYCSSDALLPPWSYTVIAFVQSYKSRPQKNNSGKKKKMFLSPLMRATMTPIVD